MKSSTQNRRFEIRVDWSLKYIIRVFYQIEEGFTFKKGLPTKLVIHMKKTTLFEETSN